MDDTGTPVSMSVAEPKPDPAIAQATEVRNAFFDRLDWLAFGVTAFLSLAVYWYTLAPEVTLDDSGELSTAAKWLGVPHPPGHPAWTIYAWLFTKIIPFSNIAWRVGVSSALAASLASGLIALMIGRLGVMLLEAAGAEQKLTPVDGRWLRLVGACVGGLGFAFSHSVWAAAVIVDTLTFRLLLMSLIICLMMCWFHIPGKRLPLYATCFLFGLASVEFQAMEFAAPMLFAIIVIGDIALGRDLAFGILLITIYSFVARLAGFLSENYANALRPTSLGTAYEVAGFLAFPVWLSLMARTHEFLTRWKPTLRMGICLLLGLTILLYSPIASMTNPPMNWAYARVPDGFFHLVGRGQYEQPTVVENFAIFTQQIPFYVRIAKADVGLPYLGAALIPLGWLHRLSSRARVWMLTLMLGYLILSFGLLPFAHFNTGESWSLILGFGFVLAPAHLILAILSGCGLVLLGSALSPLLRSLRRPA